MTVRMTGASALAGSTIAAVAVAHTGASGGVLERMNGMTAMKDKVADLAPMMQGVVPYDALAVFEGARVIASHARETMLALFPQGSLEGVTDAKREIWSEWREFAATAEELRTHADALPETASNGLEPSAPLIGNAAGMDHSQMDMSNEN